jgi:hypothetical protein
MPNTILKRWNGTSFEELYPKTIVGQISATGSPGSTTALFGDSSWKTTPAGSGSTNQIAYWTGTTTVGALTTASYPTLTELSYVKGVTSSIQSQLNNNVTKYNFTQVNNATVTPVLIASISIPAAGYYQIEANGMWSKAITGANTSVLIGVNVDSTTGTPTLDGKFQWLNTSGATGDTVNNINGAITTTQKTFTANTATTAAITTTPWSFTGLFYSGTTVAKLLRFYVYQSVGTTGNVSNDKFGVIATKLAV